MVRLPVAAALVLGVLVASPGLTGALTTAQTATFRGGIDLVNVGVTVSDRRGTYLADLTAADFEILEDGRPQAITYFVRGDQAPSALDTHVGLLFDTSGSMNDDIALARSAAVRFLNTLSDATDMTLVDFDTEVRISPTASATFRGWSNASGAAGRTALRRCTTRSASTSIAPRRTKDGRFWCCTPTAATRAAPSGSAM